MCTWRESTVSRIEVAETGQSVRANAMECVVGRDRNVGVTQSISSMSIGIIGHSINFIENMFPSAAEAVRLGPGHCQLARIE